ncbi:MAG TPA: hypothetical protein IAA29_11905 [Candidatus Paenibacillus intestinavium]|nr:hypothetical protein [Candidatus Paenibacillus intestinavium]
MGQAHRRKRVVLLQDNMIDEHDKVIFQADIPYEVISDVIMNEDGLCVLIVDIWVDFHLVHQTVREDES